MSATALPLGQPPAAGSRGPWLVSRTSDLWVFGGSAGLAFALLL
jgi:hypothetical protein